MSSAVQSIPVQGDNGFAVGIVISQNGSPVDLTVDWENWRAQWRPTAGTASEIDLTVDDTGAGTGQLRISLGEESANMGGPGVWDFKADNKTTGLPVTWPGGPTTWNQDVTRP